MAKFSVGGEDGEGPSTSSPRRKRPRFVLRSNLRAQIEDESNDEEEEEESGDVEEEEDDGEEQQGEPAVEFRPSGGNQIGSDLIVGSRDGGVFVTLTDPEVLDCPICYEPLSVPVFQCENGHIACSLCCIKIHNKCPSCSFPTGYNRCRAIEKVIEAAKVSCQNTMYGCEEKVSYSKKHEHEKKCMFAPCKCPFADCAYLGSSKQLYQHYSGNHSNSATCFRYNHKFSITMKNDDKFAMLYEETEGVLFILNKDYDLIGNRVALSCMESFPLKRGFYYHLCAKSQGSTLRLDSFTKSIRSQANNPLSVQFLLVPTDFLGCCGQLRLDICIWRRDLGPPVSEKGITYGKW